MIPASETCPGDVAPFALPSSVLLICVKYGADEETERYLASIHLQAHLSSLHVLIVENTSDGAWSPNVSRMDWRPVQAPANLGYFGGARYGLSQYLKEQPLPQWVIVSNVDLTIPDRGFLERLEKLNVGGDVALVAPSIRSNLTGIDQNPFMRVRPSALRMHLYKWLYRSRFVVNLHELSSAAVHKLTTFARRRRAREQNASRQPIYAPHGSFLIFNRAYFERGGDLDYPEFLFGEEIYIAEKARSLNLKVVYEPSLVVVHEEHRSTKLFKSPEMARYVAASATYCANKFFPLYQGS